MFSILKIITYVGKSIYYRLIAMAMIDIVLPEGNEDGLAVMGKGLGFGCLVFLYPLKNFNNEKDNEIKNNVKNLEKKYDVKTSIGILADIKELDRAKRTGAIVFVKSSENDLQALESGKAEVMFGFEGAARKDYIHQRASGLNHVLCDIAKRKNVSAAFSFSEILNSDERKKTMGRISQNIALCRKSKVNMLIGSFAGKPYEMRAPKDLKSLFSLLGMNAKELNDSFESKIQKD